MARGGRPQGGLVSRLRVAATPFRPGNQRPTVFARVVANARNKPRIGIVFVRLGSADNRGRSRDSRDLERGWNSLP